MSLKRLCMIFAPVALLSGCASGLSKSIEQRLAISEQCRLATSVLPDKFEIPDALLSVQLGNVGKCSLHPSQTLLPMCSIEQIVDKYDLTHVPDDALPGLGTSREVRRDRRAALVSAVAALREELDSLATTIRGIDQAIKLRNEELRKANAGATARAASATDKTAPAAPPRYHADTAWLQAMHAKSGDVDTRLRQVRKKQHQVKLAVQALAMELEPAARIELEAWDANLRIHLTRFEEALSGSQALAVREGVKDLVLTHVARRTLEMLHNSLKTADAVLRELDEKAYGAVSMGYLVLGPDLQKAVNAAFENIKAAAKARETQRRQDQERADQEAHLRAGLSSAAPPQAPAPVHDPAADVLLSKPVLRELRRAACENLVQGTQFSMLTELIDTMIILQIEKEDAILTQVDAPKAENRPKTERFPEDRTHTIGRANEPEEFSPFTAYASDTFLAAAETDEQNRTGTTSAHLVTPAGAHMANIWAARQHLVTPAGVHMANAWAARQQLLTQAITARAQGGAGSDSAGQAFSGVDLVDETTVQRLADVATAKAIDDAVRLSPAIVNMRGTQVSGQISSNVSVVTAATAVSQASVTLKLNLSVSNVNNFTPTNYNNVTPVINLAVPPSAGAASNPSASLPSLCADPGLARAGADCTRTADGYVISFAQRSFRSDSCLASDLEPALTALGRGLAAYRARHGVEHKATIEGHASVRPAALAGCKAAAASPELACKYANKLRDTVTVSDCDPAAADRNVVLSAARATHAARVLETAARGALVVQKLAARGTQSAQPGGAPALDQTILIHLSPLRAN